MGLGIVIAIGFQIIILIMMLQEMMEANRLARGRGYGD